MAQGLTSKSKADTIPGIRVHRDTLSEIREEDVFADIRRGEMSFRMFQLWIEAIEAEAIALQHL